MKANSAAAAAAAATTTTTTTTSTTTTTTTPTRKIKGTYGGKQKSAFRLIKIVAYMKLIKREFCKKTFE
jgi:hypothetical protein